MTTTATNEQRFQAARELLQPSMVEPEGVPEWLHEALAHNYGSPYERSTPQQLVEHVLNPVGHHWLDHWGSTRLDDGREALVAEPFANCLTVADLAHIEAVIKDLSDECDCEYWLDANSWYAPGRTIRIVLAEMRADNHRRKFPTEN